jgi:hypothetical protein
VPIEYTAARAGAARVAPVFFDSHRRTDTPRRDASATRTDRRMSEDRRQDRDSQLDPEMVAEFRAYGGIWQFLAASRRAHEQGDDALMRLRMPNGRQIADCSDEYVERVGKFLEAVGRMVSPDQPLEANETLRGLGVL